MEARELMTSNPTYCLPNDSPMKAAHIMREKNVGLVPVVADEQSKRLVGVVTDRDLVMRIMATDRKPENLKVNDVMTKNPITVKPDTSDREVEQTMAEHRVRRVLVTEGNEQLLGVIAQADIARRGTTEEIVELLKIVSEPTKGTHNR